MDRAGWFNVIIKPEGAGAADLLDSRPPGRTTRPARLSGRHRSRSRMTPRGASCAVADPGDSAGDDHDQAVACDEGTDGQQAPGHARTDDQHQPSEPDCGPGRRDQPPAPGLQGRQVRRAATPGSSAPQPVSISSRARCSYSESVITRPSRQSRHTGDGVALPGSSPLPVGMDTHRGRHGNIRWRPTSATRARTGRKGPPDQGDRAWWSGEIRLSDTASGELSAHARK